jgi:DNA ligase-1
MKPMLLCKDNPDTMTLPYPVAATPKLDGIRCLVDNKDQCVSRTLKPIPNAYIRKVLSRSAYRGFDGELIVGDPTAKDVYRKTNSVVMNKNVKVEPVDFLYVVFDWNNDLESPYSDRQQELQYYCHGMELPIKYLTPEVMESETMLLEYESKCLELGYEGVVIRDLDGRYKYGRTTMKEQNAWKLKRYMDSEALVIGIEEEMHNANEAKTNELGRTKRSTSKANLIGKGTMGALVCRDLITGVEFNIGTGFDAEDRARNDWIGKTVKYKYFPVGVKDKPRHPVYLGERSMKVDG